MLKTQLGGVIQNNMSADVDVARRAPGGSHATAALAAGTSIAGDRFTVAEYLRSCSFGEMYRAADKQTGTPVALYRLRDQLVADAATVGRVSQLIGAVAKVEHKNLAGTAEFIADAAGRFVVCEYVDGNPLAELIERKREAGSNFSPKGAYNVAAHVCNALAHVHAQGGAHGSLHSGNVIVSKAGRVKLTELGVGALFSRSLSSTEAAVFVAPEVLAGGKVTAQADIYSCGALLYHLFSGVRPTANRRPASQVAAGLPAAVDQVIDRCLAAAPGGRFQGAQQVKAALAQALGMTSGAGAATNRPATAAATPAAAPRKSLAHQLSPDQQAAVNAATPARATGASAGLATGDERFLISKGNLDYGPFTFAQVVNMIETHEIVPGNMIVDKDTGDRCPVDDHPMLSEIVDKAKEHRDELRRTEAEVEHAKTEKRRGATLYGFIAAGVVALGLGSYFVISALSAAKEDSVASLGALENSQLQATITFLSSDEKKKRRARRRSQRGQRGGGAVGGLDDFDAAFDMGDASGGGGSERLDDSQINPVIQKHGNKFGRCLSRGTTVNIQFIIKGTGRVSAVKVNGEQSGNLHSCVARIMKGMQFPSFNGARTRAEFDIGI